MRIVVVIVALMIALPASAQTTGCPIAAAMFDGYESATCSVKHIGRCTVHHDKLLGIRRVSCLPALPKVHVQALRHRYYHHITPRHPRERTIERETLRYEHTITKTK
jgi:hypothetical protein